MMFSGPTTKAAVWGCVAGLFICVGTAKAQTDAPVTREQLLRLQQQNELLLKQLQKQQDVIDSLTKKVSDIQNANVRRDQDLSALKSEIKSGDDPRPTGSQGMRFGKVDISGEGAVAFFHSEAKGQSPNAEFRIDEAKIFLEAPIWQNVYLFTELNLATHEEPDLDLHVGELYLDFENVSQLWGRDKMLNVRAGRFYIPFGEEYLTRYAIDNPLISHSLSDLWGVDEGLEIYGTIGKVQYVLAVQNGGESATRDFNADKAVVCRIGYDPTKWLHLSVSGMRTGDLDVNNDGISELWFGSGFFKSIGSTNTTRFQANLVEGDVQLHLPWMTMRAAGGLANYNDNDPKANNERNIYYYYVEALHDITTKWYGVARFSEMMSDRGYPFVGNAPIGTFFNPFMPLTTEYWRLSLGTGYRFSSNLVLKGEYSFNEGREVGGLPRRQESVFAVEAAFKF